MKKRIAELLLFCMCMLCIPGLVPAALADSETTQGTIDCVMMIPVDDVVELGRLDICIFRYYRGHAHGVYHGFVVSAKRIMR